MQSNSFNIIVHMPNDSFFAVTYYCSDVKLSPEEKKTKTQLYIQHDDCICILKIDKTMCRDNAALETLVQNKVINTKGHLC